jgi:hypothetical protein
MFGSDLVLGNFYLLCKLDILFNLNVQNDTFFTKEEGDSIR